MGLQEQLTKENYELFAAKFYRNARCLSIKEFNEDLNKVKYIKKLIKRYLTSGELKSRLILNHLITFFNMFEVDAARELLFFKIHSEEHLSVIKPFLLFLSYLPEGELLNIHADLNVTKELQKI